MRAIGQRPKGPAKVKYCVSFSFSLGAVRPILAARSKIVSLINQPESAFPCLRQSCLCEPSSRGVTLPRNPCNFNVWSTLRPRSFISSKALAQILFRCKTKVKSNCLSGTRGIAGSVDLAAASGSLHAMLSGRLTRAPGCIPKLQSTVGSCQKKFLRTMVVRLIGNLVWSVSHSRIKAWQPRFARRPRRMYRRYWHSFAPSRSSSERPMP